MLGRPAHAYAPRGAAIFFPARGSDGRDALFITAVRKRSRPSRSTRSPGLQSNRTPACDRPCRWRRSSCGADAARPGVLRAFGPRSWPCLGGGKRRTPPEWATKTGRARQKPEPGSRPFPREHVPVLGAPDILLRPRRRAPAVATRGGGRHRSARAGPEGRRRAASDRSRRRRTACRALAPADGPRRRVLCGTAAAGSGRSARGWAVRGRSLGGTNIT